MTTDELGKFGDSSRCNPTGSLCRPSALRTKYWAVYSVIDIAQSNRNSHLHCVHSVTRSLINFSRSLAAVYDMKTSPCFRHSIYLDDSSDGSTFRQAF